jgi:uncharacterized membrane protein
MPIHTLDEPVGVTSPTPPAPSPTSAHKHQLFWLAAVLIVALGAFMRIYPAGAYSDSKAYVNGGFDESLYRDYVALTERFGGVSHYPSVCAYYIKVQSEPGAVTKLPPTRFLYIYSGYLVRQLFYSNVPLGNATSKELPFDPIYIALHRVSTAASILTVILVGLAATRMMGRGVGLAALALCAASPLQIHLSQHAFIDGFFAMWATLCLWLLWENLRKPNQPGWLIAYGVSLALMVLTKENAFFVFVALSGLVTINRWAGFGTVTPRLLLVMVIGPLAGVSILIGLAGGINEFITIYRGLVESAQHFYFSIATGDGPWYRYLIELLTISPIVLVLACTGLFTLPREHRACLFLLGFVLFSYAIMCNVRYGMNLRYTPIWELTMVVFAALQLQKLGAILRPRGAWVGAVLVCLLCAYNVRQYHIFFVRHSIYEIVPDGLLRAVDIVKDIKEPARK